MESVSSAETKHNPKPKRMGFLRKAARIGAAAVVISTIVTSDSPQTTPLTEAAPSPITETLGYLNQPLNEFIKKAKSTYGLEVEAERDFLYDKNDPRQNPDFLDKYNVGPKPEIIFTAQELDIVGKVLDRLSFCSKITDKLTLIKYPPKKNPTTDWDYLSAHYEPKPDDRHKDSILFIINEGVFLDNPTITYQGLGIKTYSELLQHMFFHECGHKISFTILRTAVSEKEYSEILKAGYTSDSGTEDKNPLYIPFAKLEGWEQKKAGAFYVKKKSDSRMVYDNAKNQIEEHFAELFGLYFSNPSVLTPQERNFFGKISDGFKADPKKFAKQIAENPMTLLKD